jgi:tetratricopeptide (TPR) repeat protein
MPFAPLFYTAPTSGHLLQRNGNIMIFHRPVFWMAVLSALVAGCSKENASTASTPRTQQPGVRQPPVRNFQTPWQDETQYIVEMIAADLTEMAYYAKHQKPFESAAWPIDAQEQSPESFGSPTYRVTVQLGTDGEVACDVPVTAPVWSPTTYRPLVRALFQKLELGNAGVPPAPDGEDLLATLTEPRADILAKADLALSERLTREFSVPFHHEEAAALLGMFALREASGKFFQIRAELCRMTAHLAFAEGLRGGRDPSPTGQLAAATLTALYNNEATALTLLQAVPETDGTASWKRALRMRITGDFRIIGETSRPTLWEELEWFRARTRVVSADRAWADLRLRDDWKPLADWARVVNSERPTVQMGHVMLAIGTPVEIRECVLAYGAEHGGELTDANLVEALNVEPTRCVVPAGGGTARIRVLGWGLWAGFLQRHLCHTIVSNFDFMEYLWGVPDRARAFRQDMDKLCGGLRLYPFVRRQDATDSAYYRQAQDDSMALVRRSPHHVPAEVWNAVCYVVPFGPIYIPKPHAFINEWHKHNPPPGTAYDPPPRMNHPSLVARPDVVAQLERLHALAPYDSDISRNLLRFRNGDKTTAAHVARVFEAALEYDVEPCMWIARLSEDHPAAYEEWLTKAAALDPSYYNRLAWFLVGMKREEPAATAFRQWIANETDEVAIANDAGWLIDYYERTGETREATQLAERAAATYSRRGLLAQAHLLAERRDYPGALQRLEQVNERYDDPGPEIGFLLRHKRLTGDAQYDARLDGLMKSNLPGGLVKVDPEALRAPPALGVLVHTKNFYVEQAGLQQGDIVVAVRGYRVTDWRSFKVIRALEPDTPYALKAWRGSSYIDIGPLPARFRFGIDFLDYHAKR